MAIAFGSCALTSGRDSGIINHVIVLHAPATRVPAHLLTNPLVAAQNSGTGTSEVRTKLLILACRRMCDIS